MDQGVRVSLCMGQHNAKTRAEFETAYETHFESIFLFLAARINDRERAKELAQETFMRTWTHMANGNTIYLMRPFLYTTAHNLFKNELRRKRDTVSLETLMEATGFEASDETIATEQESLAKELFAKMKTLPIKQQETLRLRYAEGLPIQAIAERSGESPSAVAVRIHRAIKQLHKKYERLD